MDSQDFTTPVAKPSNRAAYLLLLGTLVAGSALLVNRVRAQQKSLALKELMPPATDTHYPALTSRPGASAFDHVPALVTTHGDAQPLGGARAYTTYAPTVTVERPAAEVEPGAKRADSASWRVIAYELAETLLLTLFIFVLMRTFIINYRIEGSSMEPNLHEGQHLIVSKVNYFLDGPERGDVIVFEYPYSLPQEEKDYIKRVIGIPGDTVECRPGEMVVNGYVIEETYGPNPWSYTCTPTTLKANEYFVLGDNRSASSDSHQWGVLERKYIIGKAYFAYWPLNQVEVVPNADIIAPEPAVPVAQN